MPIDYHALKAWRFEDIEHSYTERDAILYALSVGFGDDPLDLRALDYTYGPALRAAPTMAAVLGFPGQWMRHPDTGIDWVKVVHGEQCIRLFKPMPASGTIIGRSRVKAVADKGRDKGALVLIERQVIDKPSGALLASVEQLNFCRGDGGFTERGQPGDDAPPPPPAVPGTAPDLIRELRTRPDAALLYRLNGDPNPLHADPGVARAAGFTRPILHGLATFGIAGRAILEGVCDYDPARLGMLYARFSAPVMPGETISIEMWHGAKEVLFRAKSKERGVVVLNNGRATVS
jgi:acyl dehydratase